MKLSKKQIKEYWKKFWHFIWYEDSILSWLANIALAFLIIFYIVYPLLGLTMGTNLPIVAVVSSSMEHNMNFNDWWDQGNNPINPNEFYNAYNITKDEFEEFSFKNGFNKGDIIFLVGTDTNNIRIGDVIVFSSLTKSYPIIHRVISIRNETELTYTTKGDNNPAPLVVPGRIDETNVKASDFIGRAVLKIPYIGYVKLWAVDLVNFVKNIFS